MDEIQHAMAKAFFASAWADQCEESEQAGMLSGAEIMDIMPATIDPAAIHAARTLAFDMERVNGASLDALYERALAVACGDREPTRDMFGHYCAMQAMGTGVGLDDAFGQPAYEAVEVPYVEFGGHSLQGDYFVAEPEAEAD